jgi:hypothetical protein
MTIFKDFTEDNYRNIIKTVQKEYKFYSFKHARIENRYKEKHVLWRHDIDMSPHRAARIAQIESEEDIRSTYFLHLHSSFYNLFEESPLEKIYSIIDCGHEIGLHFDIGFYQQVMPDLNALLMIQEETKFILDWLYINPTSISFHNPSLQKTDIPNSDFICGLKNAHSLFIRQNYTYCSDSNSVWNHNPLEDAIEDEHPRIHVLTHPEWWTDVPMSRHEKVERCIVGRCEDQRRRYNLLMEDVYGK